VCVEHRLVEGDAVAEILRAAVEGHCDLIVMGAHGRSGMERLLVGSVAAEVLHRAPCPALAVQLPRRRPTAAERSAFSRTRSPASTPSAARLLEV
jgi:hypothetical protein